MVDKSAVATAYSFLHQKARVYEHSSLAQQRDDIEYAVSEFVDAMSPDLRSALSLGRSGFLKEHTTFAHDIAEAVNHLESML